MPVSKAMADARGWAGFIVTIADAARITGEGSGRVETVGCASVPTIWAPDCPRVRGIRDDAIDPEADLPSDTSRIRGGIPTTRTGCRTGAPSAERLRS